MTALKKMIEKASKSKTRKSSKRISENAKLVVKFEFSDSTTPSYYIVDNNNNICTELFSDTEANEQLKKAK